MFFKVGVLKNVAIFNRGIKGSPEQGRTEGASGPRPQKFPVDLPFFSDEPFKCALIERSHPKYT